MIAEARGIASIPDELGSAEAAPLLSAGITTYNALRNAGLRGGDLAAVQGIGGLGHLGISLLVSGLAARGKLIVVAVPQDQMQLSAFPLVFGGRSIYGALAGTAIETEEALAFSVLENIRPMIETVPLEQAAEAYARMMQGKARFRMVLLTKDGVAQQASVNR
jgi:alcohol dehydrogenase, propanol-preferring